PVTNPDYQSAPVRELLHGLHDRRELRQSARPQVIAIREPAGQDHGIKALQRRVLMPDELDGFANHRLDRVIAVVIAVGSRKDDHTELHRGSHTIRNSSITGLVRTSFASFWTISFPRSGDTPSARFTSKYLPCRTSATSGRPMDLTLRWMVIP